ncbi:hypothetical protein D8W73_00795 [Citrobacter amalonaticus]|nr:hypothetical protein [Citrobacter amalonaticus]
MSLSWKSNATAQGVNKNAKILRSDEDFECWYHEQFDLSMFTEMEIKVMMDEERPEYYPCIPVRQEGSFEVIYLGEDLIELWFKKLYEVTISSI